jgi:O-antigen biosynthesis protein
LKVTVVVDELPGAKSSASTGFSTIASHLSWLLAQKGCTVSVFHADSLPLAPNNPWTALFNDVGIMLKAFQPNDDIIKPHWMKRPVMVFEQLRTGADEVILFPAVGALGHACVIAKRCGLAFQDTILATITHSTTSWLLKADRKFPSGKEDLAIAHMERITTEYSDAMISPSHYFTDWLRTSGWALPEQTSMIPYWIGDRRLEVRPRVPQSGSAQLAHLAFWGRFETRKGIELFLRSLTSDRLRGCTFDLSFIGQPGTMSAEAIACFIAENRPDLRNRLQIRCDLNSEEALTYLADNGCVSVIPSLIDNSPFVIYALLNRGLPFIASSAGGIPELINVTDRQRCLFDPHVRAVSDKLHEALISPIPFAPRSACEPRGVADAWIKWLERIQQAVEVPYPWRRRASSRSTDYKISVIITHYNRPLLLERTLQALRQQTDSDFETIVVDDGSTNAEAIAFVDRLGKGYEGLRLRVFRQENRYLGAARNTGIRHVTTPYIIFSDDDDVPLPTMVATFRTAVACSGADIISCQMQILYDDLHRSYKTAKREVWAFSAGPIALGALSNCFGGAVAIYRRDLFDKVGLFHELYGVGHEDWQMHLRAAMTGRMILSLPVPLYCYRLAGTSMTSSTSKYDNMLAIASVVRPNMGMCFADLLELLIGQELTAGTPSQGGHVFHPLEFNVYDEWEIADSTDVLAGSYAIESSRGKKFVWVGPKATLELRPVAGKNRLKIRGWAPVSRHREQNGVSDLIIEVTVDRQKIGHLHLDRDGEFEHTFIFPELDVVNHEIITIGFNANSGISEAVDKRVLSYVIERIWLEADEQE